MLSPLLARVVPTTHRFMSVVPLVCLVCALLLDASALGQEGPWTTIRSSAVAGLEKAQLAAEGGVEGLLALIPEGDEGEYGFGNREELRGAVLGVPFRVLTISPKAIAEGRVDALTVVDEWRFPILVKGEAKTLLSVAHVGGGYKAVSLGGAGLARHLEAAQKLSGVANQAGARFILRIYQLRSDFLLVAEGDGFRLWPLPSARRMLSLDGRRSYKLAELLPILSNALDETGGDQ